MGWSINNGASITQDGYVTIPSTSSAKSYQVTYTNGSCTCYHTINQSAPGPGPEPTECTNWSSWSSWSVDDLSCRGGDSSATASRTRYCLANPSDIDTEYKTVEFSTTSCNSGNRQLIYNSGGITVYQAGGCSCGSPSTCDSETHKTSGCISKDGGSGILIGTYDSMAGCSGTWTVTEKPSWLSNISFSNGNITATVEPNTGDERTERVKTYLSDIGSDYFDVTQCKGSGGGGCSCSDFTFSPSSNVVSVDSGTTTMFEYIYYTGCTKLDVTVRNPQGDDFVHVSSHDYSSSTNQGTIKLAIENNVGAARNSNVGLKVNSSDSSYCKDIQYQQKKGGSAPSCKITINVSASMNTGDISCTDPRGQTAGYNSGVITVAASATGGNIPESIPVDITFSGECSSYCETTSTTERGKGKTTITIPSGTPQTKTTDIYTSSFNVTSFLGICSGFKGLAVTRASTTKTISGCQIEINY